jgi:uncharacterized protein (TIGR02646 family)
MRKIIKGIEPSSWTEKRTAPGAVYERTADLADALLKEQGYICAYCSRRIPIKDANSNEDTRIEHIKCRKNYTALTLDYKNMVICCPGAINSGFHCDKKKGDRDINFDIFSDGFHSTLEYKTSDGSIKSTDNLWDREINEILNLNNRLLCANRVNALEGLVEVMRRSKSWTKAKINDQLTKYNSKDRYGKYKPYGNIVVWYLKKKLRRL